MIDDDLWLLHTHSSEHPVSAYSPSPTASTSLRQFFVVAPDLILKINQLINEI